MTTQRADALEADIARQRVQLAATVDELQKQLQVRARSVVTRAAVLAGATAAVAVLVIVVKRRRS
jgi:hypothetical protein